MIKLLIIIACIAALAYSYKHNINDVKSMLDPKNICPPPSQVNANLPRKPDGSKGRMGELVYQQEMLNYKTEEKKALARDKVIQAEMQRKNKKPCHVKSAKKEEAPADLLDQLLHGWGWY